MTRIFTITLLFLALSVMSQEEKEGEGEKGNHRITIALCHSNVSKGVTDSGSKWLSLPAFGLDYDYWFANKWAIGLHTDITVESFEVEENLNSESETIERTTPIAPAVVSIFKPTKHSSFLLGAGVEFSKEENLFLNRVGYEWGTEIAGDWELGFAFCYDFRWNAYDSYSIGIGISKIFKSKHE